MNTDIWSLSEAQEVYQLKRNILKVLDWPSQNPDLNSIEMLWQVLKLSVPTWKPSNVLELNQFCKEQLASIFLYRTAIPLIRMSQKIIFKNPNEIQI